MTTQTFQTKEEAIAFIENANALLGFPDDKGTETYSNVPDETIIKGTDEDVTESYYEVIVTSELEMLLNPVIATVENDTEVNESFTDIS